MDRVVRETREAWGTRAVESIDWKTVEDGLFQRIENERRAQRARISIAQPRAWRTAVVALACVAAMLALGVRRDGGDSASAPRSAFLNEGAGHVVSVDGDGIGRINGAIAQRDAVLRLGDVIQSQGGAITVEQDGRFTFVLEPDTRARVIKVHGGGGLVLALESGAVEARVTPLGEGEAFAIDIGSARVAVHGTHLRVARADVGSTPGLGAPHTETRVWVDLSEGVIALGEAPRFGTVVGSVFAAPAHGEFVASDPLGSLRVSHDPGTLRPSAWVNTPPASPSPPPAPSPPKVEPPRAPASPSPITGSRVEPSVKKGDAGSAGALVDAAGAAEPLDPSVVVSNAVHACMTRTVPPRSENVTVVVTTTLFLTLQEDGAVRSARFEPPVARDVNECAARTIYRVRFPHAGDTVRSLTVPIGVQERVP